MSRMIQLYSREVGSDRKQRILKLVAAYPYLLRQHIRPGCLCAKNTEQIHAKHRLLLRENRLRYKPETRHEGQDHYSSLDGKNKMQQRRECWVDRRDLPWSLFESGSLSAIARTENRPLWVCDRMSSLVMEVQYGENFTSRERLCLLGMVDKLTNAIGQCERIHQTAVPLNYARHSLRSLTLWLFTLPFALISDLGLLAAPVNACIAWLLFGVYQIGYSIEDPFQGSLRLSILCDAIRRNVLGSGRADALQMDDDGPVDLPPTIFPSNSTLTHILVDQALLDAPKLVSANGTWTEVGI
jgi:predicted membrane chloride channel (bestrophin family)